MSVYDYKLLDALNSIAKSAERAATALEKLSLFAERVHRPDGMVSLGSPVPDSAEDRKLLADTIRKVLEEQIQTNSVRDQPSAETSGPETVGQRIKAKRKAAGITQKELAEKLGIKYKAIAMWECGRRNPKITTLLKISEALGCSVMYLTFGIEGRGEH